nr:Two component regulator three Y domain protein [Flavobacterium sp.]
MKIKITLLLVLLTTANLFAAVSTKEKEALVSLYQATNGSQWTHTWDLTSPVHTWFGVVIKNDKVVSLDLSNNHLVGTLPEAITELVHLQKLNLFRNEVAGVIPASISNLKDLKYLNLSFNKLGGTIPSQLRDLTNLQSVELFMNELTGAIPTQIGNLKQLKV